MGQSELELYLTVDEAARWESALTAFDALTALETPEPRELASAPCLFGWRRILVPATEPALTGAVSGHPRLPGQRRIVTSRLLAIDPAAGWARTLSRYYRLGPSGA